jgi:antitoxin ParD1/3/4
MTTVTISLPDSLNEFIENEVETNGYDDVSEYMRCLIRAEQKRQAKAQLEEMLLDGMALGEPVALTSEIWSELRQDAPAVADEEKAAHPETSHCAGHGATCCGKHHPAAE